MARETVQSVERAFQIIELMAERGTMGVREIAHETGLHSTVVHRILGTLVELGYADKQVETDKYLLTYKMLAIGSGIQERNGVVKLVHPYLVQLSEECKETVHLVERAGTNIRYIDKITPSANMFATGSYVGLEFPLAGTAVGKAILSELTEDEVKKVWDESHIVKYTPNTICELDTLLSELDETKQTGFAYDNEEREVGLFCVGVSVPDYRGIYSYGISISAPLARMQEDSLKEVQKHLWATREKVTAIIGKHVGGR
ncbi:MAG TPA: IclR family transcriptional regulator [Candidatus Pelethocola excrementipullorum]|nr:IclR family transcriptional regulator [Candidatus Pelethocola excrementipullorum]